MKIIEDALKRKIKKSKILLYVYVIKGLLKEKLFAFSLLKNILIIIFIIIFQKYIKHKKIIVINLEEHIGDIVACEPVSRYARERYLNDYLIWITKYRYKELVCYNPNIDKVLCVTCLFEWIIIKRLNLFSYVIDLHIHNRECTAFHKTLNNPNKLGITLDNYFFYGCIIESFSLAANLPKLSIAPIFHFNENVNFNCIFDKYIVIHCTSNEECKNWDSAKWINLVSALIQEGFKVVEIGLENVIPMSDEYYNRYFNYCSKLSFQEIACLIKNANLFIGIDSSFAHFSNAVGTYGIILLGKYRVYNKYMPYSGNYSDGSNGDIIQFNGKSADIPFDVVYDLAKKHLADKNIDHM